MPAAHTVSSAGIFFPVAVVTPSAATAVTRSPVSTCTLSPRSTAKSSSGCMRRMSVASAAPRPEPVSSRNASQAGKTNHDYVNELKTGELKTGLTELSFYFDYAWYGNFTINETQFQKVKGTFGFWKDKV